MSFSPVLRFAVACLVAATLLPMGLVPTPAVAAGGHLVVSEVVTGGASANDELIELYNASPTALPLEGIELVYVSASGATVSRRAGWEAGTPTLAPGAHLLVANELGVFAAIADALYAGGMAATGGSVALRIQGATTAVDAVGWGTATGAWLEGVPASAPPPGSSIERLPGGSAGSTVDTDDNAADFVVRSLPDPQNTGSPLVPDPVTPTPSPVPSALPSPSATESPVTTPLPSTTPAPSESASAVPIGVARGLADGSAVTIDATAVTGSAFADGGGYLADASGGIAVLLDAGLFARGDRVLVSGTVDDRFAQRTLRAATVAVHPGGEVPAPAPRATGTVDEAVEGRLVALDATIDGGSTTLSGGLAFDVDDGSGVARVVVGSPSGIDTSGWVDGRRISVVGVVGQRDSSGTGTSGYRVQPRDPADVELLAMPAPTPAPSESASPQPTSPAPTASGAAGVVVSIVNARAAPVNAHLTVRGVVTLPAGTIEAESAVLQDATGAILLRLGADVGPLEHGEVVEVDGVRSTKSGMESLRVSLQPRRLGSASEPTARALRTGDVGEGAEAQIVLVRGALASDARRASSGTVSFEIDDGSGPLRVVLGAALRASDEHLVSDSWVEVLGVLGQETTGSQPTLGYRVWPRDETEVRVLASATDVSGASTAAGGQVNDEGASSGGGVASSESLAAIYAGSLADLRVGATLVTGAWEELELAGLLWDGERVVGIDASSGRVLERALASRRPPISLELGRMNADGTHEQLGSAVVTLGAGTGDVLVGSAPPAEPLGRLPARDAPAAWVSIVGHLSTAAGRTTISVDGASVPVEQHCDQRQASHSGLASVRGVALPHPARIIVPCDGIGPAPALELAPPPVAGDSGGTTSDQVLAASARNLPAASSRRVLAVGLLAAGVVAILVAALARRRLGPQDGGEALGDDVPEGEDVAGGAQLTLLRQPHERGP